MPGILKINDCLDYFQSAVMGGNRGGPWTIKRSQTRDCETHTHTQALNLAAVC